MSRLSPSMQVGTWCLFTSRLPQHGSGSTIGCPSAGSLLLSNGIATLSGQGGRSSTRFPKLVPTDPADGRLLPGGSATFSKQVHPGIAISGRQRGDGSVVRASCRHKKSVGMFNKTASTGSWAVAGLASWPLISIFMVGTTSYSCGNSKHYWASCGE